MILTGSEIKKEIDNGYIVISPFVTNQLNPNSYNYRLNSKIKSFKGLDGNRQIFEENIIPEEGMVLQPHILYLATTFEVIGSSKYSMSLIGRSSIGRLGLFLQVSANLGHVNSQHRWTLELVAAKKIRIYPNMIIGQVSFWENNGEEHAYTGFYGKINKIQESTFYDTDR